MRFLDSRDAYFDAKKNLNEKYFFILKIFDFENFDFLKKNLIFQKSKISIEKSIFSSKNFT